jgi:hypothetical protein
MTTISPKALIRNLIETQYMDFDDVLVFNNPELDGTIGRSLGYENLEKLVQSIQSQLWPLESEVRNLKR